MRVETILQDILAKNLEKSGLRATRINIVTEMAKTLIADTASLTLTSLGRNLPGTTHEKHKIKRVDRALNNEALYTDLPKAYKAMFEDFLRQRINLDIIVDWSGCCNWNESCIRAALVCDGRSLTIYQEVHECKMQQKHEIHLQFLKNLKKMIPPDCKVTIITDRGFQTKWFELVLKMGWDFIGRISSFLCYKLNNSGDWKQISQLYAQAKSKPEKLGEGLIGKKREVHGFFYRFKSKPKGRKNKKIKNRPKYPHLDKDYSNQNSTPWIIATSHSPDIRNTNNIINAYYSRMQIEQTFRDDKSERVGYGFKFGRTRSVKRISILLFVAAIASFALMITGATAESKMLQRKYQANTISTRRVLSMITLGKRIIKQGIDKFRRPELVQGMMTLAKGIPACVG